MTTLSKLIAKNLDSLEKIAKHRGKSVDEVYDELVSSKGKSSIDDVIEKEVKRIDNVPIASSSSLKQVVDTGRKQMDSPLRPETLDAIQTGSRPASVRSIQSATDALPMGERETAQNALVGGRVGEAQEVLARNTSRSNSKRNAAAIGTLGAIGGGAALLSSDGEDGEDPQLSARSLPPGAATASIEETTVIEGDSERQPTHSGPPSIEHVDNFLSKLAERKERLSPARRAYFDDKVKELEDRMEAARQRFDADKDRAAWAEVAETVGQALTQLGAGYQGLRSGVDLSGLNFKQTDWSKRYNQILSELDTRLSDLKEERQQVRSIQKEEESEIEARNKETSGVLIRDYFTRRQELESYRKQLAKAEETDSEKADKERLKITTKLNKDIATMDQAIGDLTDLAEDRIRTKDREKKWIEARDKLNKIGFPTDQLEQLRAANQKEGWFSSSTDWNSLKEYLQAQKGDMQQFVTTISSETTRQQPTRQQQPSGENTVLMQDPSGNLFQVPAQSVKKALDNKWNLVEDGE